MDLGVQNLYTKPPSIATTHLAVHTEVESCKNWVNADGLVMVTWQVAEQAKADAFFSCHAHTPNVLSN